MGIAQGVIGVYVSCRDQVGLHHQETMYSPSIALCVDARVHNRDIIQINLEYHEYLLRPR